MKRVETLSGKNLPRLAVAKPGWPVERPAHEGNYPLLDRSRTKHSRWLRQAGALLLLFLAVWVSIGEAKATTVKIHDVAVIQQQGKFVAETDINEQQHRYMVSGSLFLAGICIFLAYLCIKRGARLPKSGRANRP